MNRHPVTTRVLRRIQDETSQPYIAAFERRDSDLYLCLRQDGQDMDWVNQDTFQIWTAVRDGKPEVYGKPIVPDERGRVQWT